jgi:hypothetical protein
MELDRLSGLEGVHFSQRAIYPQILRKREREMGTVMSPRITKLIRAVPWIWEESSQGMKALPIVTPLTEQR